MSNNKLSKSSESKPTQNHNDLSYKVAVGYEPKKGQRLVQVLNFEDYTNMINTLIYICEGKHSVIRKEHNPRILYAFQDEQNIKWKVLNNLKLRLNVREEFL